MTEPAATRGETAAWVADVLQAAYFRGMLADDRERRRADLAEVESRLQVSVDADDRLAIYNLERALDELRGELDQLNRLIGRLERRFPVDSQSDS
jgi:hypothetical protein